MSSKGGLFGILSSLLTALEAGPCSNSDLSNKVNLDTKASIGYINLLLQLDLASKDKINNFRITQRGKSFMREYGNFMQFIPNVPTMDPYRFVDTLDKRRHMVLFYEDLAYGRMVQYRFIYNGLQKGERCILLLHENGLIEKDMAISGIDVEGYKRKNLLHIHRIPNPMEDADGAVSGAEKIWRTVTAGINTPFRLVGRMLPEVNTEEKIQAQINVERHFHKAFNNLQCSIMCYYDIDRIEAGRRGEWMSSIIQNHDAAIFAVSHDKGMAFEV